MLPLARWHLSTRGQSGVQESHTFQQNFPGVNHFTLYAPWCLGLISQRDSIS